MKRTVSASVGLCGLLAMGLAGGCSSDPASNECLGNGAAALRTCAGGSTLKGVDVSSYQGTVNFSQVKAANNTFAFIRSSDGLTHPDSQFAASWPAAKKAGLVRSAYQFFRPGEDPAAQAKMMLDAIAAAGGLAPGDLPPVLDLEVTDGQPASTVVAHATTWLKAVQAKIGVKPIVYTANFMSGTIGTAFAGYTLWVANYGASCPLMPSGWSDWQFWQNADNGTVGGISGGVDTDLFNGTRAQLDALTIKSASGGGGGTAKPPAGAADPTPSGASPNDGSQGATIGAGAPPPPETTGAPLDPCAPR